MDQALFDQHVKFFSQAESEGTLFTKNLLKALGQYGEVALGKLFRTETEEMPTLDLDPCTTKFVKELQRNPEDPPKIDTTITKETVPDNYKNWKECMSTSPEGRYLSLYKT
eukprot:14096281-Ditylum_brightwellii.AAC.1